MSIIEIVSTNLSSRIQILNKNHDKNFLLFTCITKSQKSNSFNELYIVDKISTSANRANFPFQIISTSA
ncbi:hypothetical protein HOF65_00210 [bacterium]|nr:hypothetical protein [bacterium]MBT4632637.1 hypothetical protein [bacterium]